MKLTPIKSINEAIENYNKATTQAYNQEVRTDFIPTMPVSYYDAVTRNEAYRQEVNRIMQEKIEEALALIEADTKDRFLHQSKDAIDLNSNQYFSPSTLETKPIKESRRILFDKKALKESAKVYIAFSDFKPEGLAKSRFEAIKDAGKLQEFEDYIEELYPEGIDEVELNDLLAHEFDLIYRDLEMEELLDESLEARRHDRRIAEGAFMNTWSNLLTNKNKLLAFADTLDEVYERKNGMQVTYDLFQRICMRLFKATFEEDTEERDLEYQLPGDRDVEELRDELREIYEDINDRIRPYLEGVGSNLDGDYKEYEKAIY